MYQDFFESEIGWLKIQATEKEVVSLEFTDCVQTVEKGNEILKICQKQLKEYFSGKRKEFDIPMRLNGTEFQKNVWMKVAEIPYGKVVSYKEIAEKIGNSKAVRAVGTAIGKNPIAILIPCHRVIGANGSMTGYAYGIDKKEKLLEWERENTNFLV